MITIDNDNVDHDSDDEPYTGPERRSGEPRRKGVDRRNDIRFEPDKEDRRKSPGRRKEDKDPWFDHSL